MSDDLYTTSTATANKPLIKVEGLKKLFPVDKGLFRRTDEYIHAVDGVDFEIPHGQSLGLVGESGCGKSTTGRMLVRLTEATEGRILLHSDDASDGEEYVDVAHIDRSKQKAFRKRVQMIFQDPYESLNPRRTVFDTISEPMAVQGLASYKEREDAVAELLERVGLSPASAYIYRYPHELSGGQRQRVAIARALIINPKFVVADEPTSMLDVSIRISIMELMLKLGIEFDVSYLYITHDLAVARYMCDRIAVMYLGKIVELAPTEELLSNPQHPYTKALISAVPVPDPKFERPEVEILGSVSKPINPPPLCRFIERCPWAADVCHNNQHPPLEEKSKDHYVACYLV
ncbi:MAG: ATP-binding cassette domain-containing protein [Nitriliruptorales bacterium]|nr:ATP-binding cassette domain-containing protein [Nitriliruptorales bacterium]